MDPFGFALLATVTGIGGGTLRDLLIGAGPVFLGRRSDRRTRLPDGRRWPTFCLGPADGRLRWRIARPRPALGRRPGLALFAVIGTGKALDAGVPALSAVALGTLRRRSAGSSAIARRHDAPRLRQEIYVTAAALGAAVMVGLIASAWNRPRRVRGLRRCLYPEGPGAAARMVAAGFPTSGLTSEARIHAVDDVADTREELGAVRNPGEPTIRT